MLKFTLFVVLGHLATWAYSQELTCTSHGAFADRASPLCREYYACIANRDGGFNKIWAKCADNYQFHWSLNTCVMDQYFACPNNPGETVAALPPLRPSVPQRPSIPQPPIIGQSPHLPQPPIFPVPPTTPFVCPGSGNFPDPSSTDCRSFFRCTSVGSRVTRMACRSQRVFNWQQRRCVEETGLEGCPANAPAFHCSGVGNFLAPTSFDCSSYYRCFLNYDGQLRRQLNSCPIDEAFDHYRKRCLSRKFAVCAALAPYENKLD